VAAIQAIVDDLHTDAALLALVGSNYAVGRLASKENNSPPRVVWIPVDGQIGPTDNVGGRLNGGNISRQVRTRLQNFKVSIWGTDVASAENILDTLVAAGWRRNVGSIAFGSLEWFTQQEATADYAEFGQRVILDVTIKIPIHDYVLPATVIADEAHEGNFVSDQTGVPETVC